MKFTEEKKLLYSLLSQGKLEEAAKVKKHLLKRVLKRKSKGKSFDSKHVIK